MRKKPFNPDLCSVLIQNGFQYLVSPKGEIIGSIRKTTITDDATDSPAEAVIELQVNLIHGIDEHN